MTQKRPRSTVSGMRSRHLGSKLRQSTASPKKNGVAARELQEARRKRREREVMRNRAILAAAIVLVLAVIITLLVKLFGSIFSSKAADTTTITFNDDGQVVFEEVIDFDTDTYSKSDLEDYSEDLVEKFNKKSKKDVVSLDKVKVKNNKAYIKSTYKNAKVYSKFTSYKTYAGTYEKAVDDGCKFADVFSEVKDGKKGVGQVIDTESLFAGKKVAIINENCTVVVPGTIEYVSESSTQIVDSNTVKIAPADGNEDATETVYIIYK